jgi:hypothetical protein
MNMHKISDFLLKILIPVAIFAAISVFTIHLNKAYAQGSVTQSTDTKNSTEPNASAEGGKNNADTKTATIKITNKLVGLNLIKRSLLIDDFEVAKISASEDLTLSIQPGKHTLALKDPNPFDMGSSVITDDFIEGKVHTFEVIQDAGNSVLNMFVPFGSAMFGKKGQNAEFVIKPVSIK